jgi:hypothetical protein
MGLPWFPFKDFDVGINRNIYQNETMGLLLLSFRDIEVYYYCPSEILMCRYTKECPSEILMCRYTKEGSGWKIFYPNKYQWYTQESNQQLKHTHNKQLLSKSRKIPIETKYESHIEKLKETILQSIDSFF